jgi:hypothetical protein
MDARRRSRRAKSDKGDAYALAEILRTGWYRATVAALVGTGGLHPIAYVIHAPETRCNASRVTHGTPHYKLRLHHFGGRWIEASGARRYA